MNVQLVSEHHLEFLSLKEGCTEWSESTLVKMPHCWKSHVAAQFSILLLCSTNPACPSTTGVVLDFSLTVKAATLIFISRRCSAISSAKEG